MDYIAGNCGMNGFIKPSAKFPASAYAKDFDNNGSFDAVFSTYIPSSTTDKTIREFPIAGRDEFIREMSGMKERFPNYTSYAKADLTNLFSPQELSGVLKLSVNNFSSCWIENEGNMQFVLHPLPAQAQWAPVYGIVASDLNDDGNIDLVLNGNEFSMTPMLGRYDALNGLALEGDGKGNFKSLSTMQSGIYIPGNGKSITQLVTNNAIALAAAQNGSYLKMFGSKSLNEKIIRLSPTDIQLLYN
jgi:hypothetical protein